MEDVYVQGICNDYTPLSPSFCVEVNNICVEVEGSIDSVAKISCCANGNIEEIFNSLDKTYAAVYLDINLRIDYISNDENMSFHMYKSNSFVYVNLGDCVKKKDYNIDVEILDLSVLNTEYNKIFIYYIYIVSLY